ncbi:hypothetical protein K458DRAFT_392717 [Lentithecium fluviatile CBS 122367]|uniref:Pre-rRNA-processing protein RIX1 n=1 Tax=Lentithecium fluviatile CBS 122367 TaxID=1168545 RepID=A0A6G1IR17_9PLEO|nr:hypothetical protein K458DRAFT_392717 [Lentithecium fluviatile CBS 122367]
MAPTPTELATLRALTFRISSTSTSQLPQHVPAIASSLANCRSLLSSAQTTGPKSSTEASVAIHKYRTLLSTLLQDRTIRGRWAAIILIKSTIEIGGWETLQKSLPWVRGLLGILSKPEPPSSKKLCLITLTRIFVLTREYPTLVREITTPSLPAFIQASLQIASSSPPASLLQTILECFNQLLPRHPTIFRSYLKQIYPLLEHTIAPTPSSKLSLEQTPGPGFEATTGVAAAARQLYTQLPCSAPKGASSQEWQESFKKTIDNVHHISDKVFRAVVEDWKPSSRDLRNVNGQTLEDEVQTLEADAMALPSWSGIFAGGERLVNLLRLVKDYIDCSTVGPVSLDVAVVIDLLTRLFSLTIPSSSGSKSFQSAIRFNNQVGKEERENLWLILPNVHVAAIDILQTLMCRCDKSTSAIDTIMLDQLVYVFASERDTPRVRTACYLAVAELLKRSGVALPKSLIDPLGLIIRTCCDDILPLDQSMSSSSKQSPQQAKTNGNSQQTLTNADTFLSATKGHQNSSVMFRGVQDAAYALLTVSLTNIQPHCLSESMRTRMDRTAILVGQKDAMVASVLNQPPSRKFGKPAASILPLLAQIHPGGQDVEAILRPRMPVIRTGGQDPVDDDDEEQSDEAQDGEEEEDRFVGNELDTLLETAANTNGVGEDIAITEAIDVAPTAASVNTPGISGHEESDPNNVDWSKGGNKRPQEENASLSPTKRAKTSETSEIATAPALIAVPNSIPTTVEVPATSGASASGEAVSAVPFASKTPILPPLAPLAQPPVEDSDDEDIVPLVLGQDTDEEYD